MPALRKSDVRYASINMPRSSSNTVGSITMMSGSSSRWKRNGTMVPQLTTRPRRRRRSGAAAPDDPALLVDGAADVAPDPIIEHDPIGFEQIVFLPTVKPPGLQAFAQDPAAPIQQPLDGVGDL